MVQYLADVSAVRDEGGDSHLPATDEAQQREHLAEVLSSCQKKGEAFQLIWISLITPQPFGRRSPHSRQQTPGHAILAFV
jgi:hypothetical protein